MKLRDKIPGWVRMNKIKLAETFSGEDLCTRTEAFAVKCIDGRWRFQTVVTEFYHKDPGFETLKECQAVVRSNLKPNDIEWRLMDEFNVHVGVYSRQQGEDWDMNYRIEDKECEV